MAVNKKSRSRNLAVQALYQSLVTATKPEESDKLIAGVIESAGNPPHDKALLRQLVDGVFYRQTDLEALIEKNVTGKWKMENVTGVLRAILLLASFELLVLEDMPIKVVITEYLNVTDLYFDAPERKFVNGVLDAIAKEVRNG